VFDAVNSTPLSATISVENTPIFVQTNPNNGSYQLNLPNGTYTITVKSDAHRITHQMQTIQSGDIHQQDFYLQPTPRILLVDSGAWYYRSQIGYYEQALQSLDYYYHEWVIHSPYGNAGIPDDRPTTSTLNAYNLVIWSAPYDSPGLLNLGTVISSYLSSGGNILLSGQDIAYFDGGGPNFYSPQPYFTKLMGIEYQSEGNLHPLHGNPKTPFAGITLELNTSDSANNQDTPDSIKIINDTLANPILTWDNGEVGGTIAEACAPYKALWLGFGLEGSGSTAERINFLDRALGWFSSARPHFSFVSKVKQGDTISNPNSVVTATFQIANNGTNPDIYNLDASNSLWQAEILLPNGNTFSDHASLPIPACHSTTITATIPIPSDALRDQTSQLHFDITSQGNPNLTVTLTASAKTPAPILVVDDQPFYDHLPAYTSALANLNNLYDIIQTNGFNSPLTQTLSRYPLVLWTTGYDWYFTLSNEDKKRISQYLSNGNGFLLTSQDVLDIRGMDNFFQTKMGVAGATLSVTPTLAIFPPNNILQLQPKAFSLDFPFTNWGDAILPGNQTETIFYDQNLNTIGILHNDNDYRTAFFSFPLETLPNTPRNDLLNRTLFWLSPFGNSQFILPQATASNGELPIEIHLQRRTPTSGVNKMAFPIPNFTSLKPDSIQGDWSYRPDLNALVWQGELQTEQIVPLKATLQISQDIPTTSPLLLNFQFSDEKGGLINYQEAIPINQSAIQVNKEWDPHQAQPGDVIHFTINLTNNGVIPDTVILTETLKEGLQVIPESLLYQSGSISQLSGSGFNWQIPLNPQESAQLNYQARIVQLKPGGFVFARSDWQSSFDSWLTYSKIDIPWIYYFPFVSAP
ncbi:MAG: hypothetical protein ACPL7A_00660, partial [Anaerolineales bacterium]